MNAKQVRSMLKWVHLFTALLVGYTVYAPIHEYPTLQIIGRFVVFPIMLITGVGMWQWARIRTAQKKREKATR